MTFSTTLTLTVLILQLSYLGRTREDLPRLAIYPTMVQFPPLVSHANESNLDARLSMFECLCKRFFPLLSFWGRHCQRVYRFLRCDHLFIQVESLRLDRPSAVYRKRRHGRREGRFDAEDRDGDGDSK
jgi:hypothetical protein